MRMSEKRIIENAFSKEPTKPQLPFGMKVVQLKTINGWLLAIVESIRSGKSYEVIWYDFEGQDALDLVVKEERVAKYDYLAA